MSSATSSSTDSAAGEGAPSFTLAAPQLSLPKGGGAIRGIGEKFAANPVMGTGSMSIPIATSPGRAGFGPQLSISYDSGAGNGPFGFGWSLAQPSITRKTDKGLPQYRDAEESDVFMLSGAEDLVPVLAHSGVRPEAKPYSVGTDNYLVDSYRPRIEGLFARIERWTQTSSGEVHWRSISKDNVLTLYGKSANARIADPQDPRRVFSWLISETRDDKGNAVLYEYKAEDGVGISLTQAYERNRGGSADAQRTANRYLKRIRYGNRVTLLDESAQRPPHLTDEQVAGAGWMFEVVFDYGEQDLAVPRPNDLGSWSCRSDAFSSYRAGFEIRTTRLCKRVLMFHHFPGEEGVGQDCLVRSTDFSYVDQQNRIYTFLHKATHTSYQRNGAGYVHRSLPPVEFEYTRTIVQDIVEEIVPASLENLPIGVDGAAYQWTDLHGEGIPGILSEQADAWFYKRNLSPLTGQTVEFSPMESVLTRPNFSLSGAQFMDLAGNGQPDLVVMDGPMPGFFEHDTAEGWGSFHAFTSRLNRDMGDPNLKFIDLDGDGHADVLISENDAFVWHASLAEEGFGAARRVVQALDEEKAPRLVFADGTQSIYLSDMSGDGLTDLVRIRNGEVCYWPNLGYGRFGAKVSMDHAPHFDNPDQFDQRRIRLADIDGSGSTDIIYLHRDGVRLYFNESGNSWSAAKPLKVFPRVDDLASIVLADLLGNGTACLVWSSTLPGDARRQMRYVNLMGKHKPHLLVKTINNLGAETEVEYTSSTRFYLQDKQAGKPWITKLPFPVHVVTRTTVTDKWRNTRFSSSYSYHHGYFDGVEREFRGFAKVEQTDTESYLDFALGNIHSEHVTQDMLLYQPPIKSVTWYHTGAALERDRILSALKKEYYVVEGFAEHPLPEPTLSPANLSAEEWREAVRACKGMVLRQEVFELDADAMARGEELRVRLYTTAYRNCDIKCLQPKRANRHAVFLATESEAITYSYELDLRPPMPAPDPRIAHTLNLSFDDYGRVQQSVAVVYPRRLPYADTGGVLTPEQLALIHAVQGERHLAYAETNFTAKLVPHSHQHRLPAPCEVLTFELTGAESARGFAPSAGGYFTLEVLHEFALSDTLPNQGAKAVTKLDYQKQPSGQHANAAHKRIVEWVRMLYFKDDLSGPLNFGQPSRLGLTYETYKLALTESLLGDIFADKFDAEVRATLDKRSAAAWPRAEAGFLASGYQTDAALFNANGPASQWWMRSGVAGFSSDAGRHFYLPERYIDSFGIVTELKYDDRDLFIQSSIDAMGNTAGIWVDEITHKPRFDYRVLAPKEMVDANGNRTEVAFDILGLVVAAAVKGKGRGVDELVGFDSAASALANPATAAVQAFCTSDVMNEQTAKDWLGRATTRFVYHFGDVNGVWNQRMAGACSIVRERHADPASKLQVSLECSDGSGAVLMKKVQAEPGPIIEGGPVDSQRWIINGLTVLNNKGKPVKQYEPAFSADFGCEMPQANGFTPIMYYDAAGRVVRTEMPDGTLSRVEFSPWHAKTFDQNDTVLDSTWYQQNDRNRLDPTEPFPVTIPGLGRAPTPDERAGWLAAQHANTPEQVHFDSLGREVIAIAHNRTPDTSGVWQHDYYTTFTKLDAEGKPLWIRDARGNLAMQYITPAKANNDPGNAMPVNAVPCYDIAGNLLFQHSMDAGGRWMLMDAAGKPMLAWDVNDKDAGTTLQKRIYRTDYDALHRPTAQWLTLNNDPPALIEAFDYLDTNSFKDAQGVVDEFALAAAGAKNLIGQPIKHYDPSGLATAERLDLSGKPAHVTRTLVKMASDPTLEPELLDWAPSRTEPLENETFIQLTAYDALGRMTTLYNWHRDITFASGQQRVTLGETDRVAVYVPKYNERGALKSEWLHVRATKNTVNGIISFTQSATTEHNTEAIKAIGYNAKGQKEQLELRNGTVTTYTYDEKTSRLKSLKTTHPGTRGLQDLHYTYDPVGNITHIHDAAQATVFRNNSVIRPEHHYVYDALYRLIEGSGRENSQAPAPPSSSEGSWPHGPFPTEAVPRNYTQRYAYDKVGNFVEMQHYSPDSLTRWTRHYKTHTDSNRLDQTWYGSNTVNAVTYHHDHHGSMLNLNRVETPPLMDPEEKWGLAIQWDWRDMIRGFDCIGGGIARYHYGIDKQRTRKYITRNTAAGGTFTEDRIYLGGYELYRRRNPQGVVVEEIESLHLFEGEQRVLLVDDVLKTDRTHSASRAPYQTKPIFRYQYSNHLGSASLELDESAKIISYEEFHPYGTSAYRLMKSGIEAPAKRYRYTGMERDEESGLNYHTARYYVPWLGRWGSSDPAGFVDGFNVFIFVRGNPVHLTDPTGNQAAATKFDLSPENEEIVNSKLYPKEFVKEFLESKATCQTVEKYCQEKYPDEASIDRKIKEAKAQMSVVNKHAQKNVMHWLDNTGTELIMPSGIFEKHPSVKNALAGEEFREKFIARVRANLEEGKVQPDTVSDMFRETAISPFSLKPTADDLVLSVGGFQIQAKVKVEITKTGPNTYHGKFISWESQAFDSYDWQPGKSALPGLPSDKDMCCVENAGKGRAFLIRTDPWKTTDKEALKAFDLTVDVPEEFQKPTPIKVEERKNTKQ